MKSKNSINSIDRSLIVLFICLFIFLLPGIKQVTAQVAINNDESLPDPSAMLDVNATGLGFLVPRMTMAERPADPAEGLMIYQTDSNPGYYYFNGSAWKRIGATGLENWTRNGNDLYYNDGKIGIGNDFPTELLDVDGNIKTAGLILPEGAGDGLVLKSDEWGNATWKPLFDQPQEGETLADDTSNNSKIIDGQEIVYDTINVDAGWTFMKSETTIEVCINITHPNDWDLDIYLISPDGREIELSTKNGDDGDNYTNTCFTKSAWTWIGDGTAPFTGEFIPEGSFYNFDGSPLSGSWVLKIDDTDPSFNDGVLNSWSIQLTDINYDENEKWRRFWDNLYTDRYVGIGTGVPWGPLHINSPAGHTYFTDWEGDDFIGTAVLGVMKSNKYGPQMRFDNGSYDFIDIGQDNQGSFVVEGNDYPRLTVTQSGNVGIGTTDPQRALDVRGKVLLDDLGGGVIETYDEHHSIYMRLGYDGTENRMEFHEFGSIGFYTGGLLDSQTERMHISGNGNIGIGTSTPAAPLDIFKETEALHYGPAIRLTRSNWVNGFGSAIYHGLNDGINGETMVFGIGFNDDPTAPGNEKMVITMDGNVGIGTTNPSAQLDIYGYTETFSGGPVLRLSRSDWLGGFGSAIYHGWNDSYGETMVFGVAYNGDPIAAGNEKMVITQAAKCDRAFHGWSLAAGS